MTSKMSPEQRQAMTRLNTEAIKTCHWLALGNDVPVFYFDGLVDFWKFLEQSEEEVPSKQINFFEGVRRCRTLATPTKKCTITRSTN